jgi:hypothetical protein
VDEVHQVSGPRGQPGGARAWGWACRARGWARACRPACHILRLDLLCPESGGSARPNPLRASLRRASISRDPFYDMLATRKRRIANRK